MPQARRNAAVPEPRKTVRLSPVPDPPSRAPEDQSQNLLKTLEKISRNGGTFHADPPLKRYAFPGGTHLTLSDQIHSNLWRWGLSPMARALLDLMAAEHDEDGLVKATQQSLGKHFNCHHSKINRAMKVLDRYNFAWKYRQGWYRVHPTYAYRWGSRKQHALIMKIADELKSRKIEPPLSEMRNR